MPSKDEMLSKAISSSSRREILRLLCKNPQTVTNVSKSMNISTSLASKHLTLLDYLGIVEAEIKFPIDVKNLEENLIAIEIDKNNNKDTTTI